MMKVYELEGGRKIQIRDEHPSGDLWILDASVDDNGAVALGLRSRALDENQTTWDEIVMGLDAGAQAALGAFLLAAGRLEERSK